MTVIEFPRQAIRRDTPANTALEAAPADDRHGLSSPDLGNRQSECPFDETVAAALVVHNLVIEGLHEGIYRAGDPSGILHGQIIDIFGLDFGRWAEFQFEVIYGTDPYTFLRNILPYLDVA